jgi:hypothetical protein
LRASRDECNLGEVSPDPRCVDDEALFALARGELPQAELGGVEAHLRDCADCRAVLGEASRSLADGMQTSAAAPSTIARYEVRALIGAGAAGVVYRAFDPKLQREVAIKVLRSDPTGAPDLAARILREAQAMARLSAPNVVAVYDVGIEDGAVYLVMEHVQGSTLAHWLRAEARSVEAILAVFADAGRGLLSAHEKGLVHRDFKPENVLVAADGRARVTDFGLAREVEPTPAQLDPAAVVQLYAPTRGLVGTPAYLAPELFDGAPASAQSDQFAFCVALFDALFERHPFRAGEAITLEQLIEAARAHELAAPASTRGARGRRVASVLARGLSPDPARRFGDMGELLRELAGTARQRLTRTVIAAALATLLAALIALGVRSFHAEGVALTAAVPASVVATPAPAARAAGASSSAQPPTSISPSGVSSQRPATARKKPRKKSVDVRYQDWLKDPF